MARAAVIGEAVRTAGFALAGAVVTAARGVSTSTVVSAGSARQAARVSSGVSAAGWLGHAPFARGDLLVAVMPP